MFHRRKQEKCGKLKKKLLVGKDLSGSTPVTEIVEIRVPYF